MADKESRHEVPRRAFRWRRHGDEMQEHVGAKDDEDHSEQTACDDSCDFHSFFPFLFFACSGVSSERRGFVAFLNGCLCGVVVYASWARTCFDCVRAEASAFSGPMALFATASTRTT